MIYKCEDGELRECPLKIGDIIKITDTGGQYTSFNEARQYFGMTKVMPTPTILATQFIVYGIAFNETTRQMMFAARNIKNCHQCILYTNHKHYINHGKIIVLNDTHFQDRYAKLNRNYIAKCF